MSQNLRLLVIYPDLVSVSMRTANFAKVDSCLVACPVSVRGMGRFQEVGTSQWQPDTAVPIS